MYNYTLMFPNWRTLVKKVHKAENRELEYSMYDSINVNVNA